MTLLIGGSETGLLNTTLDLLGRNDQLGAASTDNGDSLFVNVANGNLVYRHLDTFLPSRGEDYQLLRTYNSRAAWGVPGAFSDAQWSASTGISLVTVNAGGTTTYELHAGDGSVIRFVQNPDFPPGIFVSVQGDGPHATLRATTNAKGQSTGFLVTRADQSTLAFDTGGFLTAWTDTNGVSMTFSYSAGRLVKVVDDTGHTLTYNYSRARLYSIVDETGATLVSYRYDSSSRLSSVQDRYGHVTRYFYTKQGYLERIELPTQDAGGTGQAADATRREIRFEYSLVNWAGESSASTPVLTRMTDAMGNVTTFDYAFSFAGNAYRGARTTVTDALGNVSVYECNADGFITRVTDAAGFDTSYTYDAKGNLGSVTDRNGWGAAYSDSDYYRSLRESLGFARNLADLAAADQSALLAMFTRSFTYDVRGNLLTSTDNSGNTTTYTYTSFNKPSSVSSPQGGVTRYFYDARQNLVLQVDPGGDTTRYVYDTWGNLTDRIVYLDRGRTAVANARTGPSTVVEWTLADHGFVPGQAVIFSATGTLPAGLVAGQVYYVKAVTAGTFTLAASAGGAAITYGSGGSGSGSFAVIPGDPSAERRQITHYDYDVFGNNTGTVDAEGVRTSGVFDHFGNLVRFTDGRGNSYDYAYDADNRLLTISDSLGRTTTNTYDAVGNRVAVTTDWNNHTITSVYDRNNRLIATIDPAADAARSRTVTRSYDVVGNQTGVTDAEGRTTTYTYDARRQLVQVSTAAVDDDGDAQTPAVSYSQSISYDGEGNRIAISDSLANVTRYQYTRDGLLQIETSADGQVTQYTYDRNQNLLSVVAGLQLEVSRRQRTTYAYDDEDQLLRVTDAEGNVTSYTYDAPGNVVAIEDANHHVKNMVYDRNNRLRFEVSAEVTDPATGLPTRYTVEHRFDANGNEIETVDANGQSTVYAFDAVNRNSSITDANGVKTAFAYDGNDNLTRVEIRGPGATEPTSVSTYVWDEFNQLVAETDGVGNALASSDEPVYQRLRAELGYVVSEGEATRGKRVSELSAADVANLLEAFTTRYAYDRVGNLLTETDHLGRTTSSAYDTLDRLVLRTDALGGTREYRYDGNGNLLSEADELGRVTSYTHDSMGRVETRSDPLGSGDASTLTTTAYDTFGNVTSRTEAFGTPDARTTRYEYDLNNRLTAVTDAAGHSTRYVYDAVGNRIRVTDARLNSTVYSYDALDRLVKVRDPLTFETRFEYDATGNRIAMIDARGTRTRMEFDPGNRMTALTDGEGRRTVFGYDALGNTILVTTGAGSPDAQTTRYEYDAENNLRAVVDALDQRTTFGFDRVYNRTSVTDARGNTSTMAFDALDRAVLVTDALGGTVRSSYDAAGNVLSVEDANGKLRTYAYDRANRVITETDALGVQTTYAHDAFGATTTITRAANRPGEERIQTLVHDAIGNVIRETDAAGGVRTYVYDANSNLTRMTDENGHHTDYGYDANNRVVSITDALGGVTRYVYDGNGNRTMVVDANGQMLTSFHNADNELVLSVDALGFATAYVHDANGNVTATTQYGTALALPVDPAARPEPVANASIDRTTRMTYDALNRVATMTDALGHVTRYTYDANGNRTVVEDARGNRSTSYYDAGNRLTLAVDALGFATAYAYDAVGNTIRQTQYANALGDYAPDVQPAPATGAGDRTTISWFDANNRLTLYVDALGYATGYDYDAVGNVIAETQYATALSDHASSTRPVPEVDAGDRTTRSWFDGNNRLRLSVDALGYATGYDYDAVGNVTRQTLYATRLSAGIPPVPVDSAGDRVTSTWYDANNRLVLLVDALGFATTFGHDAVGNVTRQTRHATALDLPSDPDILPAPASSAGDRSTRLWFDGNNRAVLVVDALGYATRYRYDAVGNVAQELRYATALTELGDGGLPEPGASAADRLNTFYYDANNRQTLWVDAEGYATASVYDAAGNLRQQTQFASAVGTPADPAAEPSPSAGPSDHTTTFYYDAANRVNLSIDAMGYATTSTFDAFGNLTVQIRHATASELPVNPAVVPSPARHADDRVTRAGYDALDRLILRTDSLQHTQVFSYDAFGDLVHEEDKNGNPTDYSYDMLGQLTRVTRDRSLHVDSVYDGLGNLVSTTDERGFTTLNAYDTLGRIVRTTLPQADADGNRSFTAYTFDAFGDATTVTDNGDVSTVRRDALGRVVDSEDAERGHTLSAYDAFGNVLSEQDASGVLTRYEYDRNGRRTASIDSSGARTEFTYDAFGNIISRQDPRGYTTGYAHDALNRLVLETDPLGGSIETTYDAFNQVIALRDANGNRVQVRHDSEGRVIARLSREGYLTEFEYDANGNEIEQREYNGRYSVTGDGSMPAPDTGDVPLITVSTYNSLNQLESRTDATGLTTWFEYDAAGNLERTLQSDGNQPQPAAFAASSAVSRGTVKSSGVYDANNRLVSTTDALGFVTQLVLDSKGRIKRRIEAAGTPDARITRYTYDRLDRMVSETNPLGRVISYTYDGVGRLLTRTTDGPDVEARVETFHYDGNGRLLWEENGNGTRTAYAYDDAGNRTMVTYAADTTDSSGAVVVHPEKYSVRYAYDAENRLSAMVDGEGVRTEYAYDARGNRIRTVQAAGIAGMERITTCAYDAQDRLISITNPENETTTYFYDAQGNQVCVVDARGGITFNTFDAEGRIVTNTVGAGTLIEAGSVLPEGARLVTRADQRFIVDFSSEHGGVTTTNTRDERGNVVSTTVAFDDGTDARTTRYSYDLLDQMTAITDGEGFTSRFSYDAFGNRTGVTIGLYELAANDPGYDAGRAAREFPKVTVFEFDAADQLVRTVDGEGNVVTNTYDSHGNQTSMTVGLANTDAAAGPLSDDAGHAGTTVYGYDLDGKLVSSINPEGGIVRIARDALGREQTVSTLQSGSEASGIWSRVSYQRDSFGRTTLETSAGGTQTRTVYDAVGNTRSVTIAFGTSDARETRFNYDLMNRLSSEVDPMGSVTAYEYDDVGNLVRTVDAEGGVSRLYYDAYNRVSASLSATGSLTSFERDSGGNVLRTVQHAVRVSLPAGATQPVVGASADDRTLLQTFDGNGKRVTATSSDGSRKVYTFDSAGQLRQQTEQAGTDADALARTGSTADRVISWEYDAAGRLVRFVNVDGVVETYAYDAANNRIRSTLHDPNPLATGGYDPDRITLHVYDLNNRMLEQRVGPNVQILQYDKAGNVIAKIDGLGHATSITYDLENRVDLIRDPANGVLDYRHDRVGNLLGITDARGNERVFVYDLNDRLVEEHPPAADTYTIATGLIEDAATVIRSTYDRLGNLVSRTDAAGFRTLRWYDADGRVSAEVDGDSVLRTYEYNAFGQVTAVTTHADRVVTPAALDPDVVPTGSVTGAAPHAITIRTRYDTMGRAIETVLPPVEVTTLAGSGASTRASSASAVLREQSFHDAWGNLVESVDRAGNHSYAYYDMRDRQVASVDAAGFLVETSFDAQDQVVRQVKFAVALVGVSAATRPTGSGSAAVADRFYDTRGNLVREISPAVGTADGAARVTTVFTYDAADNLLSRTSAYGTPQAQTEYYYYDSLNQRVAVVAANRSLSTFSYDANGNLDGQRRYAILVDSGVNLGSATAQSLVAGVNTPAASIDDQIRSFTYDERNQRLSETDHMGAGTADDVVVRYWYDANGNKTRKIDADGYQSRLDYDATGKITRTITPDNAYAFVEYNVFGLKSRAWTGGDPDSVAPVATDITASLANGNAAGISVRWSVDEQTGLVTWIAWDSVSHASLGASAVPSNAPNAGGAYAHGSAASADGSSSDIPIEGLVPGQTVYFRVMVKDASGNLSWSAEQSVVVPVALRAVNLSQTGSESFRVEAEFSAAVTNPRLVSGSTTVDMVPVAGTSRYRATLTGVSDPATLALGFSWSSAGTGYSTASVPLLRADSDPAETGIGNWIQWHMPQDGSGPVGTTQLVVLNGMRQGESSFYRSNETLQFDAASAGNYDVFYGDGTAEAHSFALSFSDVQTRTVTRTGYNRDSDDKIVSTNWNVRWASDNDGKVQSTVVLALDAAEAARIGSSGLLIAWRPQADDGVFDAGIAMARDGSNFSHTLDLDGSRSYDLKVYYTDTSGREVIVQWRRITTASESATVTAQVTTDGTDVQPAGSSSRTQATGTPISSADQHSLVVLASERGGVITGTAGSRTFSEGIYSGPLDASGLTCGLSTSTAGSSGRKSLGTLDNNLRPYFTEIEYNDLGQKIASNENDGLWREYGLDANGNTVLTKLLGDDRSLPFGVAPVLSHARFDARGLEVETIGPVVDGKAAITLTSYDFAQRVLSVQDPGNDAAHARRFTYDDVGNTTAETDALGGLTRHAYDLLGNLVRTVDPRGHTRVFEYSYTGLNANRLTRSYFSGLEASTNETYGYDSFGRRTSLRRGGATAETTSTIRVSYDWLDRVKTVTDAENHVTSYLYDQRGNQTWVLDAEGNVFGRGYDGMGRMTKQYSFSAKPTGLAQAWQWVEANDARVFVQTSRYDVFGNKTAVINPADESSISVFGKFGRLESLGDTSFSYDRFGRRVGETSSAGKSITRIYDAAGRLKRVEDHATGTITEYTYDAAGNRMTETLTVSGVVKRAQTYEYNARNELTRWTDRSPSSAITQGYAYWSDGNLKSVTNAAGTTEYLFDAADRLIQAGDTAYTYDYAGNRKTEGGATYTYYKNGWLRTATDGATTSTWSYDNVGNVLSRVSGSTSETNTYDANYRITVTVKVKEGKTTTTTTTFDKAGRTLSSSTVDDGKTFSYTYSYRNGQQVAVTASGPDGAYGGSTSTYDVNGRLSVVNLGTGDGENPTTSKTFSYDNDGNIIVRVAVGGTLGTTQYLYANGHPVGQFNDADAPVLNTGVYSALQSISDGFGGDSDSAFPESAINQYTVAAGDTLQSIAAQFYGTPDLWFVIAEANGLTGQEPLAAGSRLVVPNTVQNAYFTAETHALYKEGEIVGSKLPNLTTPPPKEDECAKIGAIILIVVVAIVAIVATVLTAGAAGPAAAAALGFAAGSLGAIAVSVAVGAVVGAAIAFAASCITQGILIGFGLQKDFDWKAVAADTVGGFFGGAAAGLGAAVSAARTLTTTVRVVNIVGQALLETAGEAASQAIQNDGRIVSPGLVVAAGVGGAFGAAGDVAKRSQKVAKAADGASAGVESAQRLQGFSRRANRVFETTGKVTDNLAASVDDVAADAAMRGKSVFATVFRQQFAKGVDEIFVQSAQSIGDSASKAGRAVRNGTIDFVLAAADSVRNLGAKSIKEAADSTGTYKLVNRARFRRIGEGAFDVVNEMEPAVQFRKSFLGTSKTAQLQAARNAVIDGFNDVRASVTDFLTKSLKNEQFDATGTYKAFDRTSYVRTGKGALDFEKRTTRIVSETQRFQGASLTNRFVDAVGTATTAVQNLFSRTKQTKFDPTGKFKIITELKYVRTGLDATDFTRRIDTRMLVRQSFAGTTRGARFVKGLSSAATAAEDGVRGLADVLRNLGSKSQKAFDPTGQFKIVTRKKYLRTDSGFKDVLETSMVSRQSFLGTSWTQQYDRSATAVFLGKRVPSAVSAARFFVETSDPDTSVKKSIYAPSNFLRGGSIAGFGSALTGGQMIRWGVVALKGLGVDDAARELVARFGDSSAWSEFKSDLVSGFTDADYRAAALNKDDVAGLFETARKTEEKIPYADANAYSTFTDLHDRQRNYLAIEWRQVAAGATTQALSPFAIDRSADLATIEKSNRMFSGQVAGFEMESVVKFAESTVGGVGGDPLKTPGAFV